MLRGRSESLPLNLAQGDEGWFVLIATALSVLFQTLPYWTWREPRRPG